MLTKIKIYLACAIILMVGLWGNSTFAQQALPAGGSSFETAVLLSPGQYQGGPFQEWQSPIYYSIQVKAGQEINIKTQCFPERGYTIILYNEAQEELISDYDISPEVNWLANANKSSQKYYLKIVNDASAAESFSLEVSLKNYYDANSDTDAGDTFDKALTITPGTYNGYLTGYSGIMNDVGDDWQDIYKIELKKGIPYEFKAIPPSKTLLTLSLYNSNRQLLKEEDSANGGAIVSLSLTPSADTNIFVSVANSKNPYQDALANYQLEVKSFVPLIEFYVCKNDYCELAGEFASKADCQKATAKTCYSSENCDDQCGAFPTSTTIVPPTTSSQNECTVNQTKCFDNFNYQKCGNYDDDAYLEWSSPVYCGEGNKCEKGKCVSVPPKACQCSAWVNEECAGNDCQENEMYQIRTCEPENCDKEEQCVADETCKVIPACIKNSDCSKGFLCQRGECIEKEGSWGGWLSLIAPGGLFIGWYFWLYLILGLALYIYLALSLQVLAEKTNTPNKWLAWIPIANVFLMIQIAQKPLWWFLLFLIPIVNIVIGIIIWMKIAERREKPSWLGVLTIVPVVGIAIPGYLAFSGEKKSEPIPPYTSTGTEEANKPTVGYKHPCQYCGKFIPPNSTVCPFCGKSNPLGPYRCPKCHEPIEKDWQACSHCGQNLRIVCPKCGKITFFGDYCEDCGNRLLVTCPHCGQEQPPLGGKCIKCDKPLENKK